MPKQRVGSPSGAYASLLTPTATKTANYTAAPGELVPFDTTSGALTLTLPTAPADNTRIGAKIITQGGTNGVTITAGGSDHIATGNATTRALKLLGEAVELQYQVSTALWFIPASDTPVGQLDVRYPLVAADGDVKRDKDSGAVEYALAWQVAGAAHSGLRGLKMSRGAAGSPIGLTLESVAGTPTWDTVAIDATTTNLVLAYSHLKAAGSADMIRGDVESHWTISDAAGAPDGTARLLLESTALDAATTTTLQKFSIASTSPLNAASHFHAQYSTAGSTVTQITYQGLAAFGFSYGGTLTGAGVESTRGVVVRSTDANATFWLARRGVSSQDWLIEIDSSTSNQWVLKDNGSGRRPLIFRSTAADATIFADTNGLVLGATAQKVGFRGTTPITKPAATPADATDLATALTLVNYLKNSVLIAHGLCA